MKVDRDAVQAGRRILEERLRVASARLPVIADEVALAGREAAEGWRELLAVSRPATWVFTGLPFLAGAFEAERALSLSAALGTLYFLGPYNLLLYGLGAIFDKPDVPRSRARRTWFAIAITNVPFLVVLSMVGGVAGTLALALTVVAAMAYTVPPLRTKERPGLDSLTRALHFVLPAVCGLLIAGQPITALPWLALLAVTAWALASHALGTIRRTTTDRPPGTVSIATALGARRTAAVALAGYGVAVLSTLLIGPAGALAALGLALYLLLPVMVLAVPPERGPRGEIEAARRAWTAFLGLAVLVGFGLAQLLLRHWGITTYSAWELAIVAGTILTGLVLINVAATRVATRRRPVTADADAPPRVASLTIVVPCRNEAGQLVATLTALRAQTYADTSILVVDDGSTDGSADEAAAWLGEDAVLIAPPRPDDWAGGSWACHVGAMAATGDLILFVDADTVLTPIAARVLVEQLEAGDHDLLSGVTRYAMPTVGERAAMPGFALLWIGLVPIWLSALRRGHPWVLAFAYGPLLLVRRAAYVAVGGHGAQGANMSEDIDLARRFARAGRDVGTVHAADLAVTRQARDVDGAIDAWRRVILPYAGGSLVLAIVAVLLQALAFILPLLLPLVALVADADPALLVASCVPLALLLIARVILALTQRQPLTTIAWHPVTAGLTLIGQLAGIADYVTGRPARWRARHLASPGDSGSPPVPTTGR